MKTERRQEKKTRTLAVSLVDRVVLEPRADVPWPTTKSNRPIGRVPVI